MEPITKEEFVQQYWNSKEFTEITFNELDLRGLELSRPVFTECAFSYVDFSNILAYGAKFIECTFRSCKFERALLRNVNFAKCRLQTCHFMRAQMYYSLFQGTTFQECDFTKAALSGSVFHECAAGFPCFDGARLYKAEFHDMTIPCNVPFDELRYVKFYNCTVDLGSHAAIAEILRREAQKLFNDHGSPRGFEIAGTVLVTENMCWADYKQLFTSVYDLNFIRSAFREFPELLKKVADVLLEEEDDDEYEEEEGDDTD